MSIIIKFNITNVVDVAKNTGLVLLNFYKSSKLKVSLKKDGSLLTNADLASNNFLEKSLHNLDPDIIFISEESIEQAPSEIKSDQLYWLVDPLDGTLDFINQTDDFSVSIALMQGNQPVMGVIYVPCTSVCYYAQSGLGAFRQELSYSPKPIVITSKSNRDYFVITTSPRDNLGIYRKHLSNDIKYKIISYGSCSVKCCAVFDNIADLYISSKTTMVWDTAAAHCIMIESGVIIVDLNLFALSYNFPKVLFNPKIIVSSLKLNELRSLLK